MLLSCSFLQNKLINKYTNIKQNAPKYISFLEADIEIIKNKINPPAGIETKRFNLKYLFNTKSVAIHPIHPITYNTSVNYVWKKVKLELYPQLY